MASFRIVSLTSDCIELALFAFATGIALDVYVAMERIMTPPIALSIAIAAFIVAISGVMVLILLTLWYLWPLAIRARLQRKK
jgi:hypothetical protein